MPSSLDCTLCLFRQTLDAVRFATDDTTVHREVLSHVIGTVHELGLETAPPIIGQQVHRTIRRLTNNPDPYLRVKRLFNEAMMERLDTLRTRIATSSNPFETAVRLAIGGNSIDFAVSSNIDMGQLDESLERALALPLCGDVEKLQNLISGAKKILLIADNCGEIVCDRLLVEQILRQFPDKNVTVVVRGFPIINDATYEDAEFIGLTELVPVISNGNDGLGTMLEQCSLDFFTHFDTADCILCKGLGNYETLIGYSRGDTRKEHQNFAFLFKAKCSFIAQFSGTTLGDHVIQIVPDVT